MTKLSESATPDRAILLLVLSAALGGCGSSDNGNGASEGLAAAAGDLAGGTGSATGGSGGSASGAGGKVTNSGGAVNPTGGAVGAGGSSVGSGGASLGNGGVVVATGGNLAAGSGGLPVAGGGGLNAVGGVVGSGGATAGSGGAPDGTGGVEAGGASGHSTGGAPVGGVGGAETGGVATGGLGEGGVATGGVGEGGTAAGGVDAGGAGAGGTVDSDACTITTGLEADFPECLTLQLHNGIDAARTDAAIFVTVADIRATYSDFNPNAFVIFDGTTELASQAVDNEPDDTADQIVFTVDLDADETTTLAVRYATSGTNVRTYTQRAQALVSPKTGGSWNGNTYQGGSYTDVDFLDLTGHIDHDADYMRFEGPGWESDRVGHRVYMDHRNGIDIFGKKLPGMILQDIDYTNEDYSTMSDWGMDVLHNGDALGLGSVGTWQSGAPVKMSDLQSLSVRILASGPVYALMRMTYGGWQTGVGTYNVTADISITAGSRVTRKVVTVDGDIDNLCAGMPKHDQGAVVPPPNTTGWTHLTTYGNQSLVPDALGIGVLYRSADEIQLVEDALNRLVVLSPTDGSLTYYLLAAWTQEGGGVANQQAFSSFLDSTLRELDSPVTVTIQ